MLITETYSHPQTVPPAITQVIEWVRSDPQHLISDEQLEQRGASPEEIARWFVEHYGMTFQAFQQMLRTNNALQRSVAKQSAQAGVALDNGYDFLGGIGCTYQHYLTGQAVRNPTEVIVAHRFTTPIGPMFVCATEQGVCLLEFVDQRRLDKGFRDLQRLFKARIIDGENVHTRQTEQEIGEYFTGKRHYFEVALTTPGSDFQRSVWQALQTIPYGQTASYQLQAQKIGNPKAVRAVAGANGANRIGIIIPCHRIIGKDGSLTGYGGSLVRKQWLLEHERNHL